MNKEIVYIGENCGALTKQDIMEEINLWIKSVPYFDQLLKNELVKIKEKVYIQLLDRLEWQSPLTLLNEYDEEDIKELV